MSINYPKGSGRTVSHRPALATPPATREDSSPPTPPRSGGQSHTPGKMNKLEDRWAQVLDARVHLCEVALYRFEAVTLRLADGCRYTPDFLVMIADGTLELHECKGFMRDDAAVKLKVCAEMYPMFRVRLVRRVKGAWVETLIGAREAGAQT